MTLDSHTVCGFVDAARAQACSWSGPLWMPPALEQLSERWMACQSEAWLAIREGRSELKIEQIVARWFPIGSYHRAVDLALNEMRVARGLQLHHLRFGLWVWRDPYELLESS